MRHILHIVTKPDDAFACKIIDGETSGQDAQCEVVDLTKRNASYDQLVQKIFAADSVQVW